MLFPIANNFTTYLIHSICNSFLQRIATHNFDEIYSLTQCESLTCPIFLLLLSFFEHFESDSINDAFIFILNQAQSQQTLSQRSHAEFGLLSLDQLGHLVVDEVQLGVVSEYPLWQQLS